MGSINQNESDVLQNKSLSTVKEEKEEDKFFLTCESEQGFKKKVENQSNTFEKENKKIVFMENLNETIRDLRRENLIYKEEMKSLRKEIQDKDNQIQQFREQSKTLLNLIKFRPQWKANFTETIKLFEYILDYCSENEYFYIDPSKGDRQKSSILIPQINFLLNNIREGFNCLKEINETKLESSCFDGSINNLSHTEILSSIKKLKRVQTENDLSISNEFKLDLGFIKEDFLRKNYTFDVPTTSEDGSAVSKKMKSEESKYKDDQKKIVYICSIEQQLSSEKKSYKINKNDITGITNGFVIVEKRDQPQEIQKKLFYNNLFTKDTKEKPFKTIESKEMNELQENEEAKKTGGFEVNKLNLFEEEYNGKKDVSEKQKDLIFTVSKESMKEDIISKPKNDSKVIRNNKILDNFSFNFNENKSFARIKEQSQIDEDNTIKPKSIKLNCIQKNLFKNNCESIKSVETEENISFVQSQVRNEVMDRSDEIQLVTSEVMKKSETFKIESNYFNIRPVGKIVKKKKKKSKMISFENHKKLGSSKRKNLKMFSFTKNSIASILTPKLKSAQLSLYDKENKFKKSFKFIKNKKKNPFESDNTNKSLNMSKQSKNLQRILNKSKERIKRVKMSRKVNKFSTSPTNLMNFNKKINKKANTKSSKLFKMRKKSPKAYDLNFRFSHLSNNIKKRARKKTPKNCLDKNNNTFMKSKLKTFNKKYINSLKIPLDQSFKLNRKKSCNLNRKGYDSFVLHVNSKYSNKNLINKNDLINLTYIK
jgi:hypothetical protein